MTDHKEEEIIATSRVHTRDAIRRSTRRSNTRRSTKRKVTTAISVALNKASADQSTGTLGMQDHIELLMTHVMGHQFIIEESTNLWYI